MNTSRTALVVTVAPLLVAAAAIAAYRFLRLASIGAAFMSKIICSGVFGAHRDPASIIENDLAGKNLSILRRFRTEIDYKQKEVTSRFLGIIHRTARYTPGLGGTLCYDTVRYPYSALPSHSSTETPEMVEAIDPRLASVLDSSFTSRDAKHPTGTRAVVILHHGRIVAERYAPGFSKNTPLLGWSMTKTVMNALVGIMVKEGRLSLQEPVPVPEWRHPRDARGKITLNNLLQMSSGLRFREDYGNPLQDVTTMLFAVPDAASYAARKPLAAEPGTRWSYSSGTTNIISRGIREVLGDDEYVKFPRRALFEPLGMVSAVIEPDASGTFIGSSFMYATARDWAKLGQLYLQDGVWAGRRILPEGWVKYTTTPAPQAPEQKYGAHVWLKIPEEFSSGDSGRMLPADAFHAVGHEGQLVSIIPSKDLVVVRLGLTRDLGVWHHDIFVEEVAEVLGKK